MAKIEKPPFVKVNVNGRVYIFSKYSSLGKREIIFNSIADLAN